MSADITTLLREWSQGDEEALHRLIPLIYTELETRSKQHLAKERPNHTLEPPGLINEVYLRLINGKAVDWKDRAHFFAISSKKMREILADHAKSRGAQKRGSGETPIELDEGLFAATGGLGIEDYLTFEQALAALTEIDRRKAKALELRFFGGLRHREIAEVLGLSLSTVKREVVLARKWIARAFGRC